MKPVRNFAVAFVLLITAFAVYHLPHISAQEQSCCMTPFTSCKATALGTKTNCINTCASEYTKGSTQYNSCVATCTAAYNTAINACVQQDNYCLETGQQECEDITCPELCEDESSVTYCKYVDNCPSPNCAVTCSCPMPPPDCPTPLCDGTEWVCYSPIVIDWKGEGFHLTSPQEGVYFDFTGKGHTRKVAWTDPAYSNAWLALDRNGNGRIDNGTELFGNLTPQLPSDSPNGFLALAVYDKPENGGNGNGFIDPGDAIYPKLLLWIDSNHNGVSEPEELHTLKELGIERIDLQYQEKDYTDPYGNVFRYRSRVWDAHGERGNRWTWDVFLGHVK